MNAFLKNRTWEIVDLPKEKKTVGCKWVFTIKCKPDGSIERYKARLVAKGFTQTYGIDYQETFAPIAKINSIWILLSLAIHFSWPLHQLEVKKSLLLNQVAEDDAFLNGDLEEEVLMDLPLGFEEKLEKKVCRLKKSLYGLERFGKVIKLQEYIQSQVDHTMFYKHSKEGKIVELIVYMDNIIITSDDSLELERLKKALTREFEIKDLGPLRYFLGKEFARSKKGIFISQRKYILDLLNKTGCRGTKLRDCFVGVA